ncbi:MAG: G5 domain-containing protein, partial [Bacillota bacterium]|nr:G5 domain-containing protein [Bacillota bacterium]
DATVVDNYIDFKFKNNTSSYILIKAQVNKDHLVVRIFGDKSYKKQVEINRVIEEIIPMKTELKEDQTLTPGEEVVKNEGKPGYKTRVVRIIRENGQVVSEELISADTYPAENRVILKSLD